MRSSRIGIFGFKLSSLACAVAAERKKLKQLILRPIARGAQP
jgi:hypothetical protein